MAAAISYPSLDDRELLGKPAGVLTEEIIYACRNDRGKLTKTQVRRFYSEVKSIRRSIENEGTITDGLYARIKLIKAKASYATARKGNAALPEHFEKFLSYYLDQINFSEGPEKVKDRFERFCWLFEAFVGYSSASLAE
jgi:CRISPR type III-A-associated protein Csm2